MSNASTLYDLAPATEQALEIARSEANRYRQPLIGTEHVVLGLIQQPDTIAGRVLQSLNISEARAREAIELLAGHGSKRHAAADAKLNWTQRVQEAIDLADRLRRAFHVDQIAPEHVLLALIDIPGNTALGMFQTLGVDREQIRGVLVIAMQRNTGTQLTHLDEHGQAHMVDVGAKNETAREAIARGAVLMQAATLQAIVAGDLPKGDVLATARIAGIMAAKKTSDLVPLCHPLLLTHVGVTLTPDHAQHMLLIEATVRTTGKTGVEMEALTAVSVAALTIYDMCKAIDRGMRISDVRLAEKRGGTSGDLILDQPA